MNIFKQLIRSLYSPKDISVFRFQGIGKTILYVFFLTLLSIIPSFIYLQSAITNGVNAARDTIDKDIPSFTIQEGQLQSDMKTPITLNKEGFSIIFDSTGEVEENDLQNIDNAIAFLKHDFFFIAGGEVQSFSYSMVEDVNITKNDLIHLVNSIDSSLIIIIPILFLVIYLFSSAVKFIEISILALLGLIMKNRTGRKLNYGHIWRMSAYSVTLPTIFFTIMSAIQTQVPSTFLIHWAVALIVLYLAIKETPQAKK